jgi:phage terminase small subunit
MAEKKLTGKQRKFIEYYLGPAHFIPSKAAAMAGYRTSSPHNLHSLANDLLSKPIELPSEKNGGRIVSGGSLL